MRVDNLSALCEVLGGEHQRELRRLLDFYDAHQEALPFHVGDRVALTGAVAAINYTKAHGWSSHAGMLSPGNTGEVRAIDWSATRKSWTYSVQFDIEWSPSTWSQTERRVYITRERKHVFVMPERYLRLATETDAPVPPPCDAANYSVDSRRDLSFKEALELIGAAS